MLAGNTVLGYPSVSSEIFLMLLSFTFTSDVKSMNKYKSSSRPGGEVETGFLALQTRIKSGSAPAIGSIAIDSSTLCAIAGKA